MLQLAEILLKVVNIYCDWQVVKQINHNWSNVRPI